MPAPLLDGPRHAIGFLTRVPVPFAPDETPRLTTAAPWFPVVGAAIGAVGGGVLALVGLLAGAGPWGVAAALALAALLIVTGALHEDGLADVADGLGVHGDRERRLVAMRDPRNGTFGVLALVVWFFVGWSALRGLGTGGDGVLALIAAGALSRWAILVHAAAGRPARPDGAIHALRVGPAILLVGSVVAVGVAIACLGVVPGAVATGVAVGLALLGALGARRSFGGLTGDTCGATAAVASMAVLVVALAFVG